LKGKSMSAKTCRTCANFMQDAKCQDYGACALSISDCRDRYECMAATDVCNEWEEQDVSATNHQAFFGTPELAASTAVEHYVDALTKAQMVRVTHAERTVAVLKSRYYGVWLKRRVDA